MSNFETWWEREGQEFLYALNTTTDDDIKLVAEVAWEAALAEQVEQEPVACVACGKPTMHIGNKCYSCCQTNKPVAVYDDWLGHPIMLDDAPELTDSQPLYAAPVRTKDLTNDEIYTLYSEPCSDREMIDFARAVIAADREKNK